MRALILAALIASPVGAHEFWISPLDYTPAAGEATAAHIRVGEAFEGGAYSYFPRRFERFEVVTPEGVRAVEGRVGDRPALGDTVLPEGLNVIVHETTDSVVNYREEGKIQRFAAHKGFLDLVADETVPVDEKYRRFGKSLIGVGHAQGADAPTGMRTELVALANPYTDDLSELPVLLLEDGAPVADYQVELFRKAPDGTVEITTHMTDADGIARLPLTPGHEHMADAVLMREWPGDDAKWYSLWANLTFVVPG